MERPKTESELRQEEQDELFARQLQEQLHGSSRAAAPVPTQSAPQRFSQEDADAALARQLQEEYNRQESAAAAAAAAVATSAAGRGAAAPPAGEKDIAVECPACTFINSIKPSSSAKRWKCVQCHKPLPGKPSQNTNQHAQQDLVECKVCHSLNKLPSKKSDAVLCGGCYQELGTTLNTAPPVESEGSQRTVQLRCGQCNVINAVTVGADVKQMEFICGGCGVLNTMVLE